MSVTTSWNILWGVPVVLCVALLLALCSEYKYYGDGDLSLAEYADIKKVTIYDSDEDVFYLISDEGWQEVLGALEGARELNNYKKLYVHHQILFGDKPYVNVKSIGVFNKNIFGVEDRYYKKEGLELLPLIESTIDEHSTKVEMVWDE